MAVENTYTETHEASAPFSEVINVTPSDATVYTPSLRGIRAETDGTVVIETIKGDASATLNVVAGQIIPALITKVLATGTTATFTGGR